MQAARRRGAAMAEQPWGNYFDKYGSRNPTVQLLMRGFLKAFDELVAESQARTVHEIGCGEGKLTLRLAARMSDVRASDVSPEAVGAATALAAERGADIRFKAASIYDLRAPADAAELIVCCEVMEHLSDPEAALEILQQLTQSYLLVSVPREPIWRALNVGRLKYLTRAGNTPGHVRHWSKRGFLSLLRERFEIRAVRTPFPWTMALCRRRRS